jgi:hypothetical protein
MNPTFGRRKRAREENSSEEAENAEAPVDKELKKKLHDSNKKIYELEKTNAKIISCVGYYLYLRLFYNFLKIVKKLTISAML